MTELFASPVEEARTDGPLADRLRPRTLDEVVGQDHLLKEGGRAPPHAGDQLAGVADLLGAAGNR